MISRKEEKIEEVKKYLSELESILPLDFGVYVKDFKIRAVCERYFEKIIEAVVDVAFLVIKEKDLQIPEEDKEAFDILAKEKVISFKLSEKLKEAKGMRNILAHEYGKIDDEVVFEAVTEEIIPDVESFLEFIRK